MASFTKITERKRARRKKNMGRDRKKQLAKKGTTPKFPVNPNK